MEIERAKLGEQRQVAIIGSADEGPGNSGTTGTERTTGLKYLFWGLRSFYFLTCSSNNASELIIGCSHLHILHICPLLLGELAQESFSDSIPVTHLGPQ